MFKKVFFIYAVCLGVLVSFSGLNAIGLKGTNSFGSKSLEMYMGTPVYESYKPKTYSATASKAKRKFLFFSSKKKVQKNKVFKKFAVGNAHWSNIVSLCTGIVGFILSFFGLGWLLSLAALVFGIIGVSGDKGGKGMGIAGIILGALGFIISLIIIIAVLALL